MIISAGILALWSFCFGFRREAFRKYFYALFGAIGAILVFYGAVTQASWDAWLPLIVALFGVVPGAVAAQNVDTSLPPGVERRTQ